MAVQRRAGRRSVGFFKRTVFTVGAFVLYVRDALADDIKLMWRHARLFVGLVFVVVGTLSFASDKYCDGTTGSHYACTRPTTYYFYPWWAILLVILGSFFIVLWFLRRKKR